MKTIVVILDHLIPALQAIQRDLQTEISVFKGERTKDAVGTTASALSHGPVSNQRAFRMLKIGEASQMLGVSKALLYKMTSSKRIPYYKVGSRLLFKESELVDWVASFGVEPDGS